MRKDEYLKKREKVTQKLPDDTLNVLVSVWRSLGYNPNQYLDEHNNWYVQKLQPDSRFENLGFQTLGNHDYAIYVNNIARHMADYGAKSLRRFINVEQHRFFTAEEVAEFVELYMRRFVPYCGCSMIVREHRKSWFARTFFPFLGESRNVWTSESNWCVNDHWTDEQFHLFDYLFVKAAAFEVYNTVKEHSFMQFLNGRTVDLSSFTKYLDEVIETVSEYPFDFDVDVPLPKPTIREQVFGKDKSSGMEYSQFIYYPCDFDAENESVTIRKDLAVYGPKIELTQRELDSDATDLALHTRHSFPSIPFYTPLEKE